MKDETQSFLGFDLVMGKASDVAVLKKDVMSLHMVTGLVEGM